MSRCVIIGGANIEKYEDIRQYLRSDDFTIFCDSGLKHAEALGVTADLVVGDFDSWYLEKGIPAQTGKLNAALNYRSSGALMDNIEELRKKNDLEIPGESPKLMNGHCSGICLKPNTEILVVPHEKYDTDTMYGVREGLERGFEEFLLLGVIGQRLYHTLGNLYILDMLDSLGKRALMADDYSDMEMVSSGIGLIPDNYRSFSLLNITGIARKVRITGAKYCFLPDEEITSAYQYAVSNEVLPGQTAQVSVGEGKVLLIRDRA